jgi:cell division septation protein DedD
VAPFLKRLPSLSAGQKAAAVNFGIFPDSSDVAYAYAGPSRVGAATVASDSGDRLSGIDSWLRASPTKPAQAAWQPPKPVQVAYAAPPRPATVQQTAATTQSKIWLQLASGQNVDDLASRFQRLKEHNPDLFEGIKPYVSRSAERARLLIGPFRGMSDAQIFSEDLKTIGVDAFRFTNSQTDRIAPLAAE